MQIRKAENCDFSEIYKLISNELGYPNLVEEDVLNRLDHFTGSDEWATFVAVVDNEIAGFIGIMKGMAYTVDGFYSQIMALAVSEKVQRRGAGTALLKKAEEWSLSQGISDIVIGCNLKRLAAHDFYEAMGYTKLSYKFCKSLNNKAPQNPAITVS